MQKSLRPNRRKCVLVYHQLFSGRLSEAVATFLNFDCIEAGFLAGSHHDLILMFDLVLRLHGPQMLQMGDEESEDDISSNRDDMARVSATPRRIASIVLSQMPGVLKHFSKWDILGISIVSLILSSRLSKLHKYRSSIFLATFNASPSTCRKSTSSIICVCDCETHPFHKLKR